MKCIAEQLILLEVENNKKVLELIPHIKEVIKKFNNKTPNKRLDTALKKISDSLSFRIEYNNFSINYFCRNRYITIYKDTPDQHSNYIKNDTINILFVICNNGYIEEDSAIIDNKINAPFILKALDNTTKYINEKINIILEQLKMIEIFRKEQQKLELKITEHNDRIHPTINEYFKLKVKLDYRNY